MTQFGTNSGRGDTTTEEPKELIKIGNREINECEVEELTKDGLNRQ